MSNTNTPNTETNSQIATIVNGNPDGVSLGNGTSDKVSFYGKVPYTQRTSSIEGVAVVTTSGTASSWGAQVSSASAGVTTWSKYVASTANFSATSNLASVASVLCEVVETLVGLGLMKGG